MEYPATQLLLNNRDLDPKIISEKKSIYLGVSPVLIIDGPEELGIDVGPPTTVVCPPEETDIVVCPPGENVSGESNPKNGSQGEPVTGIKRIEHGLNDHGARRQNSCAFSCNHISVLQGQPADVRYVTCCHRGQCTDRRSHRPAEPQGDSRRRQKDFRHRYGQEGRAQRRQKPQILAGL